jgi:hypothetical protein
MTLAVNIAQSGSNNVTFRNRIINGAMVIDQRNAGASVTPASGAYTYTLDRFKAYASQASKFTVQQSSTATTGFINSLLVTSSSAYSVGASDRFDIVQGIEGLNVADLGWGASGASTVTLSFWVRSSLTGTFGGALGNSAGDRSYPFSYTISAANTFEQKTITIAGDTTGTWLKTNGAGIYLYISLGAGSTYSGTAGAWNSSFNTSATGATSVVGTNGATFYITGVQLEAGTTASPFEYRQYGTEFALCQRYFQKNPYIFGAAISTNTLGVGYVFPVVMRTGPTGALLTSTPYAEWPDNVGYTASSASFVGSIGAPGGELRISGFTGMIAGKAPMWFSQTQMSFSAEL